MSPIHKAIAAHAEQSGRLRSSTVGDSQPLLSRAGEEGEEDEAANGKNSLNVNV